MMHWVLAVAMVLCSTMAEADMEKTSKATAIFAGGCFWCVEAGFDMVPGVLETISGYTGGQVKDPTYEQVSTGETGHYEALKVVYDPTKVDYTFLLDVFWQNIDPTDTLGQFYDRGPQYRTAIFYANEEERTLAEASRAAKQKMLKQDIATQILPAAVFYPAELYHQDYHLKNPERYKAYHHGSGRDEKLKRIWGDFKKLLGN
ncbi:MAG: peptide-methionine (S)-S-oxide reductase MsrA [Alphaproteobacteria bacterium]|nr:peptide-methionine (S)-S-oxide reductase MsrA [Alphaproteobacteria bacterium]